MPTIAEVEPKFYPWLRPCHSSKVEFVRSFFGRSVDLKKSFRLCLTFNVIKLTIEKHFFFLLLRHWKSYVFLNFLGRSQRIQWIYQTWVFDRFDIWVDFEALCFCPKEVFWVLIVLTMLTSPISTILHIKKVCGGVWDIWDHSIPD